MKESNSLKFLFLLLFMGICTVTILFVAENYFKLKLYQKIVTVFNNDHFIRIQNLSPKATPIFTPLQKDILDSFYLELKPYSATTDSLGFIVTKLNHPQADLKFAFLGGSTVQCLFVEEDKRMPQAVASAVENKLELKINVWNCAAGGTHSYHSLNVLNNLAVNLNADYAFFYGNANDLGALMHYGTYNNPNIDKGLFFTLAGYEKKNSITATGLLPYTTDAIKTLLQTKPATDDFDGVRGLPLILDSAAIMPHVVRVFKMIIANCRANNTKPVLITQRNNFDKLSYAWLRKNMPFFTPTAEEYEKMKLLFHQYNGILRQIAKEENVMLIDLDNASLGFDDFYDAIHFNSKGSVAVSEIIAAQFVEKLKAENNKPGNKK